MRKEWIQYMLTICEPILTAAAEECLKKKMSVYKGRNNFQYLEAVGRIVCGIAPWLELSVDDTKEGILRKKYRELTVLSISNIVNPESRDYVDFSIGAQPLVDAAYLAQGLLRSPGLWAQLPAQIQNRVLIEIKKTRAIAPPYNNWLLFASMIEAFLLEYEHKYNKKRLYYGVKAFLAQFYKGDGMYGDGDSFNMDYYNSFVIHPMLFDTIRIMSKHSLEGSEKFSKKELPRLKRFAEIQERMISPEGAYPVLGRTLSCRFGAFHALAHAALSRCLPQSVSSGQVRCALNAVLNRHMKMGMNFDENFFLTIGFNGKQDNMAETYVSSGSPYHCTAIFLPLGLAETDVFWTERDSEWTSLKAFNGLEFDADHAFHEIRVKEKTMHNLVFVYHVIKKKFNL